ncbi:hypothetical protein RQP46_006508 [Phenoliferia psychrophenolica]
MSKRKVDGVPSISPAEGLSQVEGDSEMHVQLLGAGQEVGRSCCVIKYKGRTIVCDSGIHPAFSGMAALPFLDELDWSTVDAILITHFHLDHAASLTYVMEKTNFREGNGVVYMSHPTKAVYRYLMSDFVRVSTAGSDDKLFTEEEMVASWNTIIGFDFEQEILLPPTATCNTAVRFTSFAAGHVLGACMFLIEIAGTRVLYTGDYSTEEDRHLVPARVPVWEKKPDVMICESTYGVQSHEPRLEKEAQFTTLVQNIVKRGGRVLLPVFALGRAQELLLILDEYWSDHPELHHIPIYYISSLAVKCMDVYRQYIHTMAPNIREKFARGVNPFDFKGKNSFIRPLDRGISKLNDRGPCVVMASPGFLTNGASRELLERWAPDPRNGLIITGYSVEGVMARTIMNEPTEIQALQGGAKISRRLSVDYISFSAHVDYTQNSKFIDEVMPAHLILVHGEANNMSRLRSALKTKFGERKDDIQIYTPRNVEVVKLKFRGERMAKALGSLAETSPALGSSLSGLLVSKDFTYTFLAPSDLRDFTGLSTSVIMQRQRITVSVTWDLVRWHLQGMYGKIQQGVDAEGVPTMRVMSTVDIKAIGKHDLAVEWVGSVSNDMVADSVIALVLGVDGSPASVKRTSSGHSHSHAHPHPNTEPLTPPQSPHPSQEEGSELDQSTLPSRLDRLIAFLDSYFGHVELIQPDSLPPPSTTAPVPATDVAMVDPDPNESPEKAEMELAAKAKALEAGEAAVVESKLEHPRVPVIRVRLDDHVADVTVEDLSVTSDHEPLQRRVESVIQLAMSIVLPLSASVNVARELWGAIRKRVLPPHRNWTVPNPGDASDLHYPSYPASVHGGRSTPTGAPRSGTPTAVARFVGAGRRRKQGPEPSTQQRFTDELVALEALFRTPGERSTGVGRGGGGGAATGSASSRRGAANGALAKADAESGRGDLMHALRQLESLVERYRSAGSLADQTAVLALLLRPFRGHLGADDGAARVALDIFNTICITYPPGDSDEELERWRFLLSAMAVENLELRTRISRAIDAAVNTELHPHLWTSATSPVVIQSLLSSLVQLLHIISRSTPPPSQPPTEATQHFATISSLIERVASGDVLSPDPQHFAVSLSFPLLTFTSFPPDKFARIVALDSLLITAVGADSALREWLLDAGQELLERNWVPDAGGLMNGRVATLLGRISHSLLSSPPLPSPKTSTPPNDIFAVTDHNPVLDRRKTALHRFLSRHYPLPSIRALSPTVRGRLVYARLAFFAQGEWPLPMHASPRLEILETKQWIAEAWNAEKAPVVEAVRQAVRELEWDAVAGVLGVMTLGMEDKASETMAGATFPTLFERINTALASASSSTALQALLRHFSVRHQTIFYKPVFALVSSPTPSVVRTALQTILSLSSLLGPAQYLLRDAEMMVVALLADTGVAGAGTEGGPPGEGFESVSVGRLALLVELVTVTRAEKESAVVFADAFESRFSLFLQMREHSLLLPFSHRTLIVTLLFELRMLSKPQRRPVWLSRVLVWATSSSGGSFATLEPKNLQLSVSHAPEEPGARVLITDVAVAEPDVSFNAVALLYEDAIKESKKSSRASIPVPGIQSSPILAQAAKVASARLDARMDLIKNLDASPLTATLGLLVAVHTQLSDDELVALCPVLWASLDDRKPKPFLSACFLFLLCGERLPWILESVVADDIAHSSHIVRQNAVLRLASLFSARFDILSQPSADRSRRKPFKAGRAAINFVPIDVGSASYVAPEIPEEARLQLGGNLPPEARRALVELGWDDRTEEQTLTERQRRPLSLLPWSEIAVDPGYEALPTSPGRSPSPGGLLRRSSSAGNSILGGTKRKAIITNLMSVLLLKLTSLLRDPDVGVSVTTRDALLMFLRDDPVAVLQPILADLAGDVKHQRAAVHLVRQLSNIQAQLPCGAAHHLFNHLGGLLKTFAKDVKQSSPLVVTSFVLPAAAALVPTISDFSLRDLRKNKLEHVFLSSGAFWEAGTAPFPRQSPTTDPTPFRRLAIDSTTFHLAMVRIAQNATQAGYLRKVPREAHAVRKLMVAFSLPFADDLPAVLVPRTFLPKDRKLVDAPVKVPRQVQDLRSLSALVARSWLMSSIQILHGLSRHFNVHAELAILFDGVNRILLTHSDDTNLVGLAIRLCMLASTRFRRLFASSNGFQLFVPALFKVFVDARHNLPIASSIQYAWQRFFRSHEESFVFASLGALTPVFLARGVDDATRAVMAADLHSLLGALQGGIIDTADIAGIRGANEREEREALIEQANDRPDFFLAQFTGSEGSSADRLGTAYGDAKPFTIEHSIKLFLTVVAFEPTSTRAGEFLHLFRLLVPSFYADSTKAQVLLRQGIEALATVYSKAGKSTKRKADAAGKTSELVDARISMDGDAGAGDEEQGASAGDAATWLSMRRSFLLLVEAYHASGGELPNAAMRKTLDIVRLTLKALGATSTKTSSAFIGTYTRSVLGPTSAPTNAQVLAFLGDVAPLLRMFIRTLDFSSTFDALARIPLDSTLREDPKIANLIVSKILGPAIDACSAFAGQDRLLPSHQAIVRLTSAWLTHPLGDAFAEIERQKTTAPFLASFVFPVAVRFGARPSSLDDMDPAARLRTQATWLRLVGYAISAGESSEPSSRLSTVESRAPAAKAAFSVQIIKVAIVAGEEHLTSANGAWIKLATVLRTRFRRGGSSFLDVSGGSRSGSRNASLARPSPSGAPSWAPASHGAATPEPRTRLTVRDYTMWSLFEFLSLFPSPLLLHLRLAMREKLVDCRYATPVFRLGRKDSFGASPDRRRASSVFARPLLGSDRTSTSGARPSHASETLSVQGSPIPSGTRISRRRASSITPSDQPFRPTLELFAHDGELATGAHAQIRHLGPVQPEESDHYIEDGPNDGWTAITRINSPSLKAKAIAAVHIVQVIFGETPIEHPLLTPDEEEANLIAWTKAVAMRNLVRENALLADEFGDVLSTADQHAGE